MLCCLNRGFLMKNNLTRYLEEVYHNSVSRNCIKIILKSKTEEEYIKNIQKQIDKIIREITEIKQSIFVMDQMISFLYFNVEAQELEGFDETSSFYMKESNRLCNELKNKTKNLYDYIDVLAIAKANIDMKGELIDNERKLIKDYGDKKE